MNFKSRRILKKIEGVDSGFGGNEFYLLFVSEIRVRGKQRLAKKALINYDYSPFL